MSCLIECSLQNSSLHWNRNVFAHESGRFSDWAASKMTAGLISETKEHCVKKLFSLKLRTPKICNLPAKVWLGVRSNSPIALCSCVHSPDISRTVPAAKMTSNLRLSFSFSEIKSKLVPGSLIFSIIAFMLSSDWRFPPERRHNAGFVGKYRMWWVEMSNDKHLLLRAACCVLAYC